MGHIYRVVETLQEIPHKKVKVRWAHLLDVFISVHDDETSANKRLPANRKPGGPSSPKFCIYQPFYVHLPWFANLIFENQRCKIFLITKDSPTNYALYILATFCQTQTGAKVTLKLALERLLAWVILHSQCLDSPTESFRRWIVFGCHM